MDSFTLLSEKYKKNLICFAFLLLSLGAFFTIYPIYNYIKSSFAKLLFYGLISGQFFIDELVKRRKGLRNKT